MLNRIGEFIKKHIQDHLSIYALVFFCFLIGISVGAFTVKAIEVDQKQDLVAYLKNFFSVFHTQELKGYQILKEALYNNGQMLFLCWLMGALVLGFPVVLAITGFKGFVLGFTVGLLIEEFKLQGILLFFLAVLPQNLLLIPLFIFISVCAVSFSVGMIGVKLKKQKGIKYTKMLLGYSYYYLAALVIILLAGILEAYLAPFFIRLII